MLVLTRRVDEVTHIGPDVKVVVIDIRGRQVRLGIQAPTTLNIWRDEQDGCKQRNVEDAALRRRP